MPQIHNPKVDHECNYGIMQQMSIFYAMGWTLVGQGAVSVCYHICPTNTSLQFDTAMMYIICILTIVKIYQFSHPDATANGFATTALIACIVMVEALTLYMNNWTFYIIFLPFYAFMTILVGVHLYHLKSWKLIKSGRQLIKQKPSLQFKHKERLIFSMTFVLLNFAHGLYVVYKKIKYPDKILARITLNILALNLMAYCLYYIVRKFISTYQRCSKNKEMTRLECCWKFVSATSVFALLSLAFASMAINFYTHGSTNRNLTPAQSRNINVECAMMDFYDNHDLWHFCSGAGIFFAFMGLLTTDDDLLNVPRNEIEVF